MTNNNLRWEIQQTNCEIGLYQDFAKRRIM